MPSLCATEDRIDGAAGTQRREAPRVLFVNSGFLGHSSVARLLADVLATTTEIQAEHLNLGGELTTAERVVRKALCWRLLGRTGFQRSNLDFERFRSELHTGVLASRRIRDWESRQGRADVIHFHTQATAYASLSRMRRTPCVVSIDCTQGLASEEAPNSVERATFWPNRLYDGMVFHRAEAIIATSEWAASDLRACCPKSAHKVHVMPYPVRLDLFDAAWPEQRAAAAQRWPVRVLFMGADFPRKGGDELLAAWNAADFGDRAELVMATGWPLNGQALPPGVSQVQGVRAYSEDWRELWRTADVFVMPTRGEAFGMVYQEAAAAGVPAIGTRLNAVPEIIEDEATGLLVQPGSISDLIQSLRRLVDDAALRYRLGRAARQRAERLFAPGDYAAGLCEILRNVAATKSRPKVLTT